MIMPTISCKKRKKGRQEQPIPFIRAILICIELSGRKKAIGRATLSIKFTMDTIFGGIRIGKSILVQMVKIGYTIERIYNEKGELLNQTNPIGELASYQYDPRGRCFFFMKNPFQTASSLDAHSIQKVALKSSMRANKRLDLTTMHPMS